MHDPSNRAHDFYAFAGLAIHNVFPIRPAFSDYGPKMQWMSVGDGLQWCDYEAVGIVRLHDIFDGSAFAAWTEERHLSTPFKGPLGGGCKVGLVVWTAN
jgi:hypothetical protein